MSAQPSLYRRIMGTSFDSLPPEVQRFHSLQGNCVLQGRVTIDGPETRVGALVCRLLSLPAATTEAPMQFELSANPEREVWTRRFPGRTMTSTMRQAHDRLVETLSPVRLRFRLVASPDGLVMELEEVRALGLHCPAALMPIVQAEETASPNRLHFSVQASLPKIGRVVRYRGYLDLDSARSIPAPIRDALYRGLARNRYRFFGRREACYLPHPEEAHRFIE